MIYEISFANLTMYSAVLPDFNATKDAEKQDKNIIRADDPANKKKVIDFFNLYQD